MNQMLLFPDGAPSVSVHNGRPATTSLEVAKFFGKRHDNVVRDVRSLVANTPERFHALNFEEMSTPVKIGNGATRSDTVFVLYRDGFTLLVMGYTGPDAMRFKLAYFEAFNAMEAELAALKGVPAPNKPHTSDLLSSLGLSEDVLSLNRSLRVRLLGIAARIALMDPDQEERAFAIFGKLCSIVTARGKNVQTGSPAADFVRERLVPSRGEIQARKLYEAFKDWCYSRDVPPCSMRMFCASLRAFFPVRESNRTYFLCRFRSEADSTETLSVGEADHA